ncbi:MAG: DNA-processing protein DprA [Rikenellaceae bacterium]
MQSDNIRLSLTGIDPLVAVELLDIFGCATNLFSLTAEEIIARTRFKEKDIKKLFDIVAQERLVEEQEFIKRFSIDTYVIGDDNYPSTLSTIQDAPPILYSKGALDLSQANEKWIAIVGTRKCSNYGVTATEQIVAEIASEHPDAVIVSGLAYGIDSYAHRFALKYGLKTVAVVAHGLDMIYPSDHRDLARKIIESGGAIITEHPSKTTITRYSFLKRNRIIAGISSGLILSESPERGGSLFTANLADEYGRDVFAFPARTIDKSFAGNIKLLSDRKAHLLLSVEDIQREMVWQKDEITSAPKSFNSIILSENEQVILDLFVDNNCYAADELIQSSNLSPAKIMSILTALELKGLIRSVKGKMYVKCL